MRDAPQPTTADRGVLRLTVSLTARAGFELDKLRKWLGLSKTDLVNRAISLYHFAEEQKQDGRELALYDPRTERYERVHLV